MLQCFDALKLDKKFRPKSKSKMLYCLIKNILGPKSYLKWKFYVPKFSNQEENQEQWMNTKIQGLG